MGTRGPLSEAQHFWYIHSCSRVRHDDGTWFYFRAINRIELEIFNISKVTYLHLPTWLSSPPITFPDLDSQHERDGKAGQ
jgi:hypothetical protein